MRKKTNVSWKAEFCSASRKEFLNAVGLSLRAAVMSQKLISKQLCLMLSVFNSTMLS